jgi:hypothetical protein
VSPVLVGILALVLIAGGVFAAVQLTRDDSKESGGSGTARGDDIDASSCLDEIGPFLTALDEINSRLDVGLNVGDLSTRLGDAKVEYDKIDIENATSACGDVASDSEDAYNAYLKSVNEWNDCIQSDYCTPATPQMQKQWLKASVLLTGIHSTLGDK